MILRNIQIHSIFLFILFSINVSCMDYSVSGKSKMFGTVNAMMSNTYDQPVSYTGKFLEQLNGQDYKLIISKFVSGKYEIYVNSLGPDIAILRNSILEGISEGISFTIQALNRKLFLSKNNQYIEFVKQAKEQITAVVNEAKGRIVVSDESKNQ